SCCRQSKSKQNRHRQSSLVQLQQHALSSIKCGREQLTRRGIRRRIRRTQKTGRVRMTNYGLENVAPSLVAEGKGILAADETVPTLTKRFDTLGIKSSEQSRCTYREMLFTSPGAAEFISGVIMYDETIRQKNSTGKPLAESLAVQGILPGIKVDTGA